VKTAQAKTPQAKTAKPGATKVAMAN
jgi:hypothetical protein